MQWDKVFLINSDLICHVVIHIGKRPFYYNKCDKAYFISISDNHKSHIMIHTQESPYQYSRCDNG